MADLAVYEGRYREAVPLLEQGAAADLAAKAAERAMKMAGVTADQLDLIIVATITPDMPFPNTACLVQPTLRARRNPAFDLVAASFVVLVARSGTSGTAPRGARTVVGARSGG